MISIAKLGNSTCLPSDYSLVVGNNYLNSLEAPAVAFRANSDASSGYSDVLMAQRAESKGSFQTFLLYYTIDGSHCG